MPEANQQNWIPDDYEPGLVSVVIPSYNRAGLIAHTLESVFRQSWRPLEVIVADDGSSDETIKVLNSAAPPDGVELRVLELPHKGSAVARNKGAGASRGEFVMFLDSDDLLTVPAIEQLIGAMSDGSAEVSAGLWRDMKVGPDACTLTVPDERNLTGDWLVPLLRNQWIATCSTLYRRKCLHGVVPWRESAVLDGDFDFNARLATTGVKLAMLQQVVAYYRRHGDQLSVGNYGDKAQHTTRVLQGVEELLDANGAWTPERRSALAWRYYWTARMTWYRTDSAENFESLIRHAKRIDPHFKPPKSWYRWVANLAGYRTAERVAAFGRRLFR